MASSVVIMISLTVTAVRLGIYMMRQKEERERQERERYRDEDSYDPELVSLIREKELDDEPDSEPEPAQGGAGPYRRKGKMPASPPRQRSTGPIPDEITRWRCARCDMRVSPHEKYCASCVNGMMKRARKR